MISDKELQIVNSLLAQGKEIILSYQKSKCKIILKEVKRIELKSDKA